MKRPSPADGTGVIDLIEEAVHLLRRAPAALLAFYAIGTLPFVLAFLYFWGEMSRGAFAREHAFADAFGLALAFLWMKCWQCVFASELRLFLTGRPPSRWRRGRVFRMVLTQSAVQPFGLFLLPASALMVLPFAWIYGFFQSATVLGDGSLNTSETVRAASKQASLSLGQACLALVILGLFAFFVWLNIAIFMVMLPGLLKTFLGLNNAYIQAGVHNALNTTFLACTLALAYVCVDPLAKALFVLRCFYGQSLRSGEDLKARLLQVRTQTLAASVVLFCCLAGGVSAAPVQSVVAPSQLNQSIDEVQKESQFAWRMPREKQADAGDEHSNWIVRCLRAGAEGIISGLKWAGHTLWTGVKWIWKQLETLWPREPFSESVSSGGGFAWAPLVQVLLLILILAIAAALAVLIFRMVRQRRRRPVILADAVQAAPDLNDENVAANQLPEDGWLALARELMAQGNLRLALRAFYLAGLAHLASRELVSIAIFKSNREYEAELRRRGRAAPETLSAFSANVAVFDRVWYGLHAVTADTLRDFESNLERIRTC